MRLIGLVLSLGVIGWVLYQASGGGEAETIIPEPYMESMKKAENVEAQIQKMTQERLKNLDDE